MRPHLALDHAHDVAGGAGLEEGGRGRGLAEQPRQTNRRTRNARRTIINRTA